MTDEIKILQNNAYTQIIATGGETELDFTFPIFDAAHLKVEDVDGDGVATELTYLVDYEVSGVGQEAGGSITLSDTTYPGGAIQGHKYNLILNVPTERVTDFNERGDFTAKALNRELDLMTQASQCLKRDVTQAVKAPLGTTPESVMEELMTAAANAVSSAATASTKATEAAASATTASAKAVAASESATSASAKATEAASSATAAANSATTATTKATEASENATAAGNSATTAGGYATTATTQAEIATTQAGIATTKAGEASTSAGTATTQAGIATTKAGEASTSASNASGYATTATTQAGIATTKAGEASNSATSASGSATASAANAALAKKWAIGDPSEPDTGHSAKWYSEHMGLVFKGTYSSSVTYDNNDLVRDVGLTTTKFYVSLQDNNTGNALTNTSWWAEMWEVTTSGTIGFANITGQPSNNTNLATALNAKAPINSPAFSGTPTVPTPANSVTTTQAVNATFISNKFQVVSALPATPDVDVFYFVEE